MNGGIPCKQLKATLQTFGERSNTRRRDLRATGRLQKLLKNDRYCGGRYTSRDRDGSGLFQLVVLHNCLGFVKADLTLPRKYVGHPRGRQLKELLQIGIRQPFGIAFGMEPVQEFCVTDHADGMPVIVA